MFIETAKKNDKAIYIFNYEFENTPASPSSGNSSDLDKNVPVKNTELDVRLSHSNKDKSSNVNTETLSAEIHMEVFEFSAQNFKRAVFSD